MTNVLFNRAWKKNYSWLPIGVNGSIINLVTRGRCWIVSAVLTNCEFLSVILDDTGKENNYWDFLCILKYTIGDSNMIEESNYIILWDNASIHRSILALKTAKILNLNIHFLPPYSPSLAPVELFFKILKSKVRKLMMQREINFNWQEGRAKIFNAVVDYNTVWIKKTWVKSVHNAIQAIIRLW